MQIQVVKANWRCYNMSEKKNCNFTAEKKGEKNMAVSKAVIPVLRGEAAASIYETLRKSHIKPYSEEERAEAEKKLKVILKNRENK